MTSQYSRHMRQLGGIGGSVGLPMTVSKNDADIFYTTSEPIISLPYLDEHVAGKDVYEIDPLVKSINSEVIFPRQRLPTELYQKFMRAINARLPPCTNEKRGHEFKHCRIHVDRSTNQRLAGKPKELMTSQCIHCKSHWSGLKYPLQVHPDYPAD